MSLRSARLTFWITTTLFCATMGLSAVLYLTNVGFQEKFSHLGFPSYFRIELALFKFAGVFAFQGRSGPTRDSSSPCFPRFSHTSRAATAPPK
jgi:hypothetical protein